MYIDTYQTYTHNPTISIHKEIFSLSLQYSVPLPVPMYLPVVKIAVEGIPPPALS